ncbi:MAG: M6 family metalloprotease domain-containing protein [Bacteroidales bacterium]|nr:M6 family metalloprotease domain-containing protein [Bacteroidales bacterium]
MKKALLSAALLLVAVAAFAIPAKRGGFRYVQPDGTEIMLEKHGDEFFHWTTDMSGNVMVKDAGGFYRVGSLDMESMEIGRNMRRVMRERTQRVADPTMTHGERHIPVILVEFTDVKFSISDPKTQFYNLLNKTGYSANGGTGSVRDYYNDNSGGEFTPVFDVFGPVTLPHDMKYYGSGKNEPSAYLAVLDGAKLLDSEIDFSRYDYNSDGAVDMIMMYYAGYNEAEGGPEDSIWPHQYYADYSQQVRLDKKLISRYFCTSELKGNSGSNMCGIGTTCHEFAHTLGLPDFYDTDYEDESGRQAHGLCYFSLMSMGSYINDGRTPPYLNAEERILLGWMNEEELKELPPGKISFGSVKNNVAYKTLTPNEGEYFVYECRDLTGWDSYVSSGLLVYHVDKSKSFNVGGYTPYYLWTNWARINKINAFADHPCFYIVPSVDQENTCHWPDAYTGTMNEYPFPGKKRITSYQPVDWNGRDNGVQLSGIAYSGGKVSVSVVNPTYTGPIVESVSDLGFACISIDSNPKAGSTITPKLLPAKDDAPSKVIWYYDGVPQQGSAVVLQAGKHVLKAGLQYPDGRKESVSIVVNAL